MPIKLLLSVIFLILSFATTAKTFPKKYVDSLTALALSTTSTHPLILSRDSVLKQLWKANLPKDRIAMFNDIVKAHGGELKVETKEGEGSEFIIQIPTNL